jgi:ribosomal protein S18 acetylase RimI-like enzyme
MMHEHAILDPLRRLSKPVVRAGAMYELRPVTLDDYDLIYRIHVDAMRDVVTQQYGWNESIVSAMFRDWFRPTIIQLILVDGQPAGLLAVRREPTEFYLSNIEIVPAYQGRGLGTAVVHGVLDEARRAGLPVSLQVLKINRARRLYERLGFAAFDETETHYLMRTDARNQAFEGLL